MATIGHELIVHHVNGKAGRIYRPGYSTLLVELQAKRILEKRNDIRAIEISTVDLFTKEVSYVKTLKGARVPLFNIAWRKVGGLTFVRLGRLSLSFCITRKAV